MGSAIISLMVSHSLGLVFGRPYLRFLLCEMSRALDTQLTTSSGVVSEVVSVAASLPSQSTRRRFVKPSISSRSEEIMMMPILQRVSVNCYLGKIITGANYVGHHPLAELVNITGDRIVADFAPVT